MTFTVRSAVPQDARELADFAERSFRETFARDNSAEDMNLYASQTFGEDRQAREIADPSKRIAVAVDAHDALIGYHILRIGQPDPCVLGLKPIELQRLYVDAVWHGKGVSHHLLRDAVERSKKEGFVTMWLGVWEKNGRAQAFYRKWGFAEVGSHIFQLGNDSQRDLIFSLDL